MIDLGCSFVFRMSPSVVLAQRFSACQPEGTSLLSCFMIFTISKCSFARHSSQLQISKIIIKKIVLHYQKNLGCFVMFYAWTEPKLMSYQLQGYFLPLEFIIGGCMVAGAKRIEQLKMRSITEYCLFCNVLGKDCCEPDHLRPQPTFNL